MTPDKPSRFEDRRLRRTVLVFVALPPIATAIAAEISSTDLATSVALMVASILVLLTFLLDFTLEEFAAQRRAMRAIANDDEGIGHLIALVNEKRPKSADLLEYSALGAMPLLAALGSAGTTRRIRLLVSHPSSAVSDYQRDVRLAEGLRTLAYRIPLEAVARCGLEVKCYKERASMRGRLLGGRHLLLGWYSYDDRGMPDATGGQMSGGTNASVLCDVTEEGNGHLLSTFSRVFENLWREADQADDAWEPLRSRLPQIPSKKWLVSVRAQG